MISVLYFISLIIISVGSIGYLDKLNIKDESKTYLNGLVFGLIAFFGLIIHFNYIEPFSIIPKINIFLSLWFFAGISFFLFGYKSGLITTLFILVAKVFLTNELLIYSLILILLTALNGYYFNRTYTQRSPKTPDYKIILLFISSQIFISLVVFFIQPVKLFEQNLTGALLFMVPVMFFVNLLITLLIIKNKYQEKLFHQFENERSLLLSVLYNLSEAIIVIDKEQNILKINKLTEILLGYKSEEILGKKMSDICFLKDKSVFEDIINQIKNIHNDNVIYYSDITILSKNEEEIPVECKISAVYEKDFNDNLYIILFKDLRKIKENHFQKSELEKRYQYLSEFSLEGIYKYSTRKPIDISLPIDEQIRLFFEYGYLDDCNNVFAKMYGFESKNEIIGIPLNATLNPEDESAIKYLQDFINNNYKLANSETIEKDRFGNTKYFLNSLYGIIVDNYLTGAWGFQIDVTEDRLTTKQIRDKNKLLLSILNAPKGGIIFSLDKNYCYTAFSVSHKETMKTLMGVDIEIGMNMLDAIKIESYKTKAKNNFDKVLSGEHLNIIEEYSDKKFNRTFWLNIYSPIYDGNEIIGISALIIDITQQKQFEKELETKNLLLNTIINSIPDSIYVKDINLRKILTNKTDLKWMEYNNEKQVLGKRDDEIYGVEFAKISMEDDRKVIAGNPVINREEKITTNKNEEIIILTNKVPLYNNNGEIIGLVGIGRDITEIKKYLAELEKNQQKLNVIFNQSFQLIGLLTPSGILLDVNQTACDFIGVDAKDVINLPFTETPWWNHSKTEQEKLLDAIRSASEGKFVRKVVTHYNKEKEERIIDFTLMPIKNLDGKVVYLVAEGRDITEIRVLQEKLSESEDKYRTLVETSMDAITVLNSDGVILFENEQHKKLFKSVKVDSYSKNFFNLIANDDLKKFKVELKMVQLGKVGDYLTFRFKKDDNNTFWGEVSLKTFIDSEKNVLFMCVIRDITYKKQIEDELKKRVFELEKYNQLMIGREIKMVELKKEINSLCEKFGQPKRYPDNEIY